MSGRLEDISALKEQAVEALGRQLQSGEVVVVEVLVGWQYYEVGRKVVVQWVEMQLGLWVDPVAEER